VVSLLTTEVQNKALGAYLSEQGTASANLDLTTATLEVLACIAFKAADQPGGNRSSLRRRQARPCGETPGFKLVEEFAGLDGRLRFATTEAFVQRFGLASFGDLTSASFLDAAGEPLREPHDKGPQLLI
jgi:hypothetical protein